MRRALALLLLLLLVPAGCRGRETAEELPPPPPVEEPSPPAGKSPPIPKLPFQPPAAPEPDPTPEEPDTMALLLEESGWAAENIPGDQLIIVQASGNEAQLWAYGQGEGGGWEPFLEEISGHVGKNGVTSAKTEGDRCTPAGLYGLSLAFGVEADPGALLPYRQVSAESYWVDDPASQFYNQWVEGTAEQDWSSAEHLADYPEQYAYAALIDYNTDPVTAGAGSAIFLHCGSRTTAGCVSIPRETMVELLLWLDPAADPAILIF